MIPEPTEAMIAAGRSAWQSAIKDRNLDKWLAHIYLTMEAAREPEGPLPTESMVEDGAHILRMATPALLSQAAATLAAHVYRAMEESREPARTVGGADDLRQKVERLLDLTGLAALTTEERNECKRDAKQIVDALTAEPEAGKLREALVEVRQDVLDAQRVVRNSFFHDSLALRSALNHIDTALSRNQGR
jgi:hypothetical protein